MLEGTRGGKQKGNFVSFLSNNTHGNVSDMKKTASSWEKILILKNNKGEKLSMIPLSERVIVGMFVY